MNKFAAIICFLFFTNLIAQTDSVSILFKASSNSISWANSTVIWLRSDNLATITQVDYDTISIVDSIAIKFDNISSMLDGIPIEYETFYSFFFQNGVDSSILSSHDSRDLFWCNNRQEFIKNGISKRYFRKKMNIRFPIVFNLMFEDMANTDGYLLEIHSYSKGIRTPVYNETSPSYGLLFYELSSNNKEISTTKYALHVKEIFEFVLTTCTEKKLNTAGLLETEVRYQFIQSLIRSRAYQ